MQKGTSVSFTHETYLADSKSGCQTQYLSKKRVSRKCIVFLISSKVYPKQTAIRLPMGCNAVNTNKDQIKTDIIFFIISPYSFPNIFAYLLERILESVQKTTVNAIPMIFVISENNSMRFIS